MSRTQRRWTLVELRRTAARRAAGERTEDLAAELGVSAQALRNAWLRCGLPPPRCPRARAAARRVHDPRLLSEAYRRHHWDRETWPMIADALGWSGTPDALRLAVAKWARMEGLGTPRVPNNGPGGRPARAPRSGGTDEGCR